MIIDLSQKNESKNIFEDLFTSQIDRGYVQGKYNTYFCRYIGYDDEKAYNNNLAFLDKELSKIDKGVLIFNNSIPVPFNQELTVSIMSELVTMDTNRLSKEDINLISNEEVNTRIKKALEVVVALSIRKENFVNRNVLLSFITKLMIWCNQYLSNINWQEENNPKCIFYGQIKRHEAYFLIALSLIGMDVLYLNSLEDNIFEDIDREENYSYVIKNPIRGAILDYSKRVAMGEVIPVVKTIAHKASERVQESLYDSNVGIFKPWQFRDGNTNPVLLTSTLDEIDIYWNEPAKLRPGFEVHGKTVSVPTFFAQVNGVNRDRNEYFKLISKLRNEKYTFFMDKADILDQTWTKEGMYSLAFLLNNLGEVNFEELIKHPMYKFSYLKKENQIFIVNKINELIRTPKIFTNGINDTRRLMIIASVLCMPEKLLQLIESYDFTGSIPKLVFYINNRMDFGEEDICLLAFLNRVGFDIVVFSPCNSNNVEKAISSSYIINHMLEEIEFDLELKTVSQRLKEGFFKRIFK